MPQLSPGISLALPTSAVAVACPPRSLQRATFSGFIIPLKPTPVLSVTRHLHLHSLSPGSKLICSETHTELRFFIRKLKLETGKLCKNRIERILLLQSHANQANPLMIDYDEYTS